MIYYVFPSYNHEVLSQSSRTVEQTIHSVWSYIEQRKLKIEIQQ